jgi:hypothetical protein
MTSPDTSAQRADPFAIDAEPDLSSFKPRPAQQTPAVARATIRQISEENNFPSRSAPAKQKPKPQRRRITGRNVQINIKAKQETVDRLIAIADRRGWVLGEVLEHALAALEASQSM